MITNTNAMTPSQKIQAFFPVVAEYRTAKRGIALVTEMLKNKMQNWERKEYQQILNGHIQTVARIEKDYFHS